MALVMCLAACTTKKEISAISVDRNSVKTVYTVGDTPDFSGIKVLLTYTDGSSEELGYDDVTIEGADTSKAGEKTVTVKYGELFTTFKITVNEVAVVATAIKINVPMGVDTTVLKGATFDTSVLQIEATFSNGKKAPLSLADVTFSPIDTSTTGKKTLTVTYGSLSDSIEIEVIDIASIKVVGEPFPARIYVGEAINTNGIEILVTYSDGKSETVSEGFDITLPDTSEAGVKEIVIKYKGATCKQDIEVVAPTGLTIVAGSVEDKITVFDTLDVSGIKAVLSYTAGDPKELTAADLTVSQIDTSTAGVKELKVTYGGFEAILNVTVVGVKDITVTGIKNEILKDATVDTTAAEIMVAYTDGTFAEIPVNAVTFGTVDTTTAGDKVLTVKYLDKTVEYGIKVCEVTSIRVEGINKVVAAGEEIDLSNMKVYGVYNDTAHTEILLTEGITTNIDSIDINSEEDKNLVVSYTGAYGSFNTTVVISATAPILERIEITSWDKTIGINNTYNKSSVVVYAYYGNGTSEKITTATVNDVVTTAAGTVKLTVTYTENGVEKTAEADVKVLPVSNIVVSGIANKVNKGATLDVTGAAAAVTYSDGTDTLKANIRYGNENLVISAPDTATSGDKQLTVSFSGKTVTFAYHVVGVASVNYFSGLADTVRFGYDIDTTNLVVTVKYTDGTEKNVLVSQLEGVNVALPNTKAFTLDATGLPVVPDTCDLTVTLDGQSFAKSFTILKIANITGLNGTIPASVFVGDTTLAEKYQSGALKINVTYTNGAVYQENATPDNKYLHTVMIDTNDDGEKAIVFNYIPLGGGNYFATTNVQVMVYGIEKIEIVEGSVDTTVAKNKSFSTEKLQIKVTYTIGGMYSYVNTLDSLLTIEGNIDTSTVGKQTLTIKYRGAKTTLTVDVVDTSALAGGTIYGAILPDNLIARNAYKQNFKLQNNTYIVGDDNPYKFYLNVMVLDENFEIKDQNGQDIKYVSRVYLGEGDSKTLLEGGDLDQYVKIDKDKNTYDFTDAAVGKIFTLSIRPEAMAESEANYKSHSFKVVDGYNVYSALELNFITNRWERDMDGGDVAGDNDQLTAVYKLMKAEGLYNDGYELPAGSTAEKNIDSVPENYLTAYFNYVNSIRAVVIHNNLDITTSDIPAQYMYTHKKDGTEKAEFLEQLGIYDRRLTAASPTFDIYGNYFSIFSYKLPCVVPAKVANNEDEYSSTSLIKIKVDDREFGNYPNGDFPFANYQTNFRDLSMRDNDPNSNDQSASERHMRGFQAFKVGAHNCTITNVNAEAYAITLVTEDDYTTLNLDNVKFYNAWQGHLFLWGGNDYQSTLGKTNEPSFATNKGTIVNIKESLLAKCGGPVILAQHPDRKDACNDRSRIDVVCDEASELYSYVTGQEAWFVAVGQTQTAAQILAMNQQIQNSIPKDNNGNPLVKASYTSKNFIEGVSTVNMIMVNMGTGTTFGAAGENYTGSFTRAGVKALDMHDPKYTMSESNPTAPLMPTNPVAQGIIAQAGALGAPVFQSNYNIGNPYAGGSLTGCVYTDGQHGCFLPNVANPSAGNLPLTADSDFFKGDYITIYYQGMGIMLEYYH